MTSSSLARALIGAVSMLAMAACSAPGGGETGPVKLLEAPVGQLPEGVTPTVYRLSLKTDPAAEGFTGAVEIDVMLDKPHARIWLHSLDQRILSAFARLPDGSQVAARFTGNQAEGGVGYFDFETPLPAGGATLVIDYEAPYNFGLAGLYKVTAGGEHYLATQMEAIDARRMVPSFDEPRFKTPWVISVTAPEGDKVISNALLLSSSPAKDGFVEHMFAPTRAIQSYLVALAVGPYDESEQLLIDYKSGMRPAPIPLRGFAAKGKGAKLGEALAITLTDTSNTHVNTTTTLLGAGSTASVAASATTYSSTRASLEAQYTSLLTQMTQLSKDAGYNGTNLLAGNNLKVVFNEKGTAFLTIAGVTLDSAGLGLNAPTTGDFQVDANLSNLETALASASSTLRSQASTFGSNLSVVQNRLDFTKGLINALTTGADALVLADTNEEGANLLALQTRQQLSQTALSLSNQAQQGVLRLFS